MIPVIANQQGVFQLTVCVRNIRLTTVTTVYKYVCCYLEAHNICILLLLDGMHLMLKGFHLTLKSLPLPSFMGWRMVGSSVLGCL